MVLCELTHYHAPRTLGHLRSSSAPTMALPPPPDDELEQERDREQRRPRVGQRPPHLTQPRDLPGPHVQGRALPRGLSPGLGRQEGEQECREEPEDQGQSSEATRRHPRSPFSQAPVRKHMATLAPGWSRITQRPPLATATRRRRRKPRGCSR